MHLLYLTPSLHNPGGMERILIDKVNYFVNVDIRVSILMTEPNEGREPFYYLDSKVELIYMNIGFELSKLSNPLLEFTRRHKLKRYYLRGVLNVMNDLNITHIISTGGKELDFLSILKKKVPKNIIVICELHFYYKFRSQFLNSIGRTSFLWKFYGLIRDYQLITSLSCSDIVVVLTKDNYQYLSGKGVNVTLIPNFSDIRLDNGDSANCRCKQILAVGRLDSQKGFDLLLNAWSLIFKDFPDWSLNIYGRGIWADYLKDISSYLHLTNVSFNDPVHDVKELYLNHSVFVLPSRYEGFGLVLLEAMQCGVSSIAFNCKTGPADMIIDGVNGFLVEQGNIEALADRMKQLMNDERLRMNFSKKGQKGLATFQRERVLKKWIELFDSKSVTDLILPHE
jgi:glycosyltransferase involved in cell wall biosynthesis